MSETNNKLIQLLDKCEEVDRKSRELARGINTRAQLTGSWIMNSQQAEQVVGTAHISTIMKLMCDYLEGAPQETPIETSEPSKPGALIESTS